MKRIAITSLVFLTVFTYFVSLSLAKDDRWKKDRYEYDSRHELHGVVTSLPDSGLDGTWIVGGHEVMVTGNTSIDQEYGTISVGSYVEVKGYRSDNAIKALRIELK